MWLKDLGELYNEGWGPSSPNLPGDSRATMTPKETHDSLRHKGIFGSADSPANMASLSQASGQNPYEQEEDQMISKNTVLKLIHQCLSELDSKNQLDKSGIMSISKLKNKINRL